MTPMFEEFYELSWKTKQPRNPEYKDGFSVGREGIANVHTELPSLNVSSSREFKVTACGIDSQIIIKKSRMRCTVVRIHR